jgi:hypothetical protein
MCEFISWIEKDGLILYLTDAEIFGKDKSLLEGCKDNDFLGHGAIRNFYNIEGGLEREVRDFWNENILPKEIADKVQEFDKYWGKTFENYFQNDDLRYLIEYAPETYKPKACEQLLKQGPTNYDLRYLIEYAPETYKPKAWQQLLKQKPTNYDLRYLIEYAPETWKIKAWQQLLKQKPTNYDLIYLIEYAPEIWKIKARKLLK